MAKKPVQIPVEFSVENIAELRKQIESITPKDQREGVRRTQALASLDKISKVGDRQLSLDEAKNYLKEWRSAEKFV